VLLITVCCTKSKLCALTVTSLWARYMAVVLLFSAGVQRDSFFSALTLLVRRQVEHPVC